jgi:hypothetical protein
MPNRALALSRSILARRGSGGERFWSSRIE